MSRVLIGTAGFFYPHWRGTFYPQNLPRKDWFRYYAKHFNTVELNVSFYRLPKREIFEGWRKKAGLPAGGFVFSVKGSRFITHIKKLKDCQEPRQRFFEAARGLGGGVILWQLPPRFKANPERLEEFLRRRRTQWRYAFEFRHQSWLTKEIYRILKQYRAAVVFQDYPQWPMTEKITTDFVYLRLHGRQHLYSSCYTKRELAGWARKIKKWLIRGLDVYVYFNNDALGYAIENARTLKKLCLKKN